MIVIMSGDLFGMLQEIGGVERKAGKGAYLFHRGDPVAFLFVVMVGALELVRCQENGNALVIHRAAAGSIFAEASIFSEHYHCDGIAAANSTLLAVRKKLLRHRLREDPELSEAWAGYLARQVQQARFRSELLALKTVAERLDMWLAWQDERFPQKGQWQAVAKEIGVSHEALYRELAKRRKPST